MHSGPGLLVGEPVALRPALDSEDQSLQNRGSHGSFRCNDCHQNLALFRDQHVGLEVNEAIYGGSLGIKASIDECLSALEACPDVTISVWREDSDKQLYILKVPKRVLLKEVVPHHQMEGATTFHRKWMAMPDKHLDLSHGPVGIYKGDLGEAWSEEECRYLLHNRSDVNYAVWRREKDGVLHIFDVSSRMQARQMKYVDLLGAVSFQVTASCTGLGKTKSTNQ